LLFKQAAHFLRIKEYASGVRSEENYSFFSFMTTLMKEDIESFLAVQKLEFLLRI
jgi:hypothetical protein